MVVPASHPVVVSGDEMSESVADDVAEVTPSRCCTPAVASFPERDQPPRSTNMSSVPRRLAESARVRSMLASTAGYSVDALDPDSSDADSVRADALTEMKSRSDASTPANKEFVLDVPLKVAVRGVVVSTSLSAPRVVV